MLRARLKRHKKTQEQSSTEHGPAELDEPRPEGWWDPAAERAAQCEWLAGLFDTLTTRFEEVTPSAWAEAKRYLPKQLTSMPGYFRFAVAPYLREILDALSPASPVRELSCMKGVQLGFTVGVLENCIGFYIEHVKTAPMMLVTADAELAKLRVDTYIVPMLQHSGLDHLIQSHDEFTPQKTGKTEKQIEWEGGGYLIPFGAQNANKLRSISIQVLLRDEIDGWPDTVGLNGDPIKLSADRTVAYEASRKIVDISTPLIKGMSKIEARFAAGDQRRYFVRCLKCEHPQVLRWRRTNPETGEITGIVWELDGGRLVPDSVRYLCEKCGHPHRNEDKTRLLAPEHGAEWRPTAVAANPDHRSYHISALYSPVGMQSWDACVRKWLESWDDAANRAKDLGSLQVFYNNILGESFELRGEQLKFEMVSEHRRPAYCYGQVPNKALAIPHCGSKILVLTCAVDVHKERLNVAVMGWTRDRRVVLVDYWHFEGDTEQLDNPATWGRLRTLIEGQLTEGEGRAQRTWAYTADDGTRYPISLTLIDSGYRADTVYRFCAEYAGGVAPVKGREAPPKGATIREFSDFTTPMGTTAYNVTVDLYKDRWSAALRRGWDTQSIQPAGHFNAPVDASDKQLRELTAEIKRERIEVRTGKRLGWEWHRPSGSANELWDLLIYNSAALDLIAWDVCRRQLGLEFVNWPAFYDLCAEHKPFFFEPA